VSEWCGKKTVLNFECDLGIFVWR